MFKNHGLYIPERSYLTNLKGLLEHLISVIVLDNECLCCSFKGKNLESIRAHSTSKGHCRLPFETKEEREEFASFYDFSSINSEVKASKSKKRVGFAADNEEVTISQQDYSDDDSGFSSDSDNGINDNYTIATIDPIDSQLTLPNGQRLGHRSLQRYYRQNINGPLTPSQGQLTVATADRRLAGGITLQEHKKQEKAIHLTENKLKSRNVVRDVKRFNFQPHFRDPMLGG
jgi:pre-60S factor REI1